MTLWTSWGTNMGWQAAGAHASPGHTWWWCWRHGVIYATATRGQLWSASAARAGSAFAVLRLGLLTADRQLFVEISALLCDLLFLLAS